MQKLQLKNHTVADIEQMLKSKEDFKTATRLVCLLQIAKGGSSRNAEELLLLSHNQICIWVKRFEKEGLPGLTDKSKSGRKSRINDEQLNRLRHLVLKENPESYGYNTATWTAPLLVDWIKKDCNISYSDDAVYILLKKKLFLRHKKGKGFYPEADPQKRKEFSNSIKKTSRKNR